MQIPDRVLLFAFAFLFASCATIRHGDMEPIFVSSDPAGAEATIQCQQSEAVRGTTPARLLIPRRGVGCVLGVGKSGFVTRHIDLERGYNAAFWTNFAPASGVPAGLVAAFGGARDADTVFAVGVAGALGFAVDRISGRAFGHDPDKIDVKLEAQR